MTIIGGWACNPDDKWEMLPADKIGDAALPTGKKDYRMIYVSVKYPKNEYFKNYKDYSYYVSAYVSVSTLSSIHFVYYTNDDEKADVAKGDKIKISGLIKDFSKNPYLLDYLSFTVVDSE